MPTKNRGAIKKFSGGTILLLPIADEVTGATNSDSSDGSGWLNLAYIGETTLTDTTETEDVKDETGGVINTDEVERTVKLSGLAMQTDKATVDFFKETVRGNYYMAYHYDGKYGTGTAGADQHQEYFFGICQVKPMVEIASGTKRIPFEISVLKNESAIPFGDTGEVQLDSSIKATSGDIPAEQYYAITTTDV